MNTSTGAPRASGLILFQRHQLVLALAVCLGVVFFQTFAPDFRRPVADAIQYSKLAATLAETGTLSFGGPDNPPQMRAAPLYPVFVATVGWLDRGLVTTLRCVIDLTAKCDLSGLNGLFAVQAMIAGMSAFFVFLATWRVSQSLAVAWLTLIICLWSKVFSEYASQILTEVLAFFFIHLFLWLLVRLLTMADNRTLRTCFLAGAAVAAAALVRPAFLYLAYFMIPAMCGVLIFAAHKDLKYSAFGSAAFAVGMIAVLTPWIIRNYLTFDVAAISSGYGATILIERLAYNLMTWREWGISFIYWLPDFGDSLGQALFSENDYRRLEFEPADSLYMQGRTGFRSEVMAAFAADGRPSLLSFLLTEYIWGDLWKHTMVTISVAFRGMWVGRYVSLVGFILLPACWWILMRLGRHRLFLVYALPGFFMLGLHGFVSVNVVRYNEPLIAIFALSAAVVLVAAYKLIKHRV